jgi:hypothetical protein
MRENKAALEKHLSEISQAQFVTKPPEDNQKDDIGRIFQEVERRACSFVEEMLASRATEYAIAERGLLDLFFGAG